jgi:hypothetical protein
MSGTFVLEVPVYVRLLPLIEHAYTQPKLEATQL